MQTTQPDNKSSNIKISSSLAPNIYDPLDDISAEFNSTRYSSAVKAFSAIFGDEFKVWFEDAIMYSEIPQAYYKACKESNINDEDIIPLILEKGKRQICNIKQSA